MDPQQQAYAKGFQGTEDPAVIEKLKAEMERSLCGELRAPKPWAELSIEEKIERSRDMVKSAHLESNYLRRRIGMVESENRRLRAAFEGHQHGVNGAALAPPEDRPKEIIYGETSNAACDSSDPAKAYF